MQGNPYQAPAPAMPMGPPMGGGAGGRGGGSGYEFNASENQTIEKVGKICRLWGIIGLILGVVGLLAVIGVLIFLVTTAVSSGSSALVGPTALLGTLVPVVLVQLVIPFFYLNAGKSFTQVVTTTGNDMPHLMSASEKLGKAFLIEAIVALVAAVIGLVFGIVAQFMN